MGRLRVHCYAVVGFICIALLTPPSLLAAAVNLFVSATFSFPDTSVKAFDGTTGIPFVSDGTFASGGGMSFPRGLAFGPDGNLYVSSEGTDNILKYNGGTGAFISEFVPAGSGGLAFPKGLAFAPGGKLYVAGLDSLEGHTELFAFDASSGALLDKVTDHVVFPVPYLFGSPYGVTVGPDSMIYFACDSSNNVLRFDPVALTVSEFVTTGGMGSSIPQYLTFGPDGNLYVSIYDVPGRVLKFDGTTGAFMSTFVTSGSGGLSRAEGLEFGPDGNLYVASSDTANILRYSGVDGHFLDVFASIPFPYPFGPDGLAFHGVPEPASLFAATIGFAALLVGQRRRA